MRNQFKGVNTTNRLLSRDIGLENVYQARQSHPYRLRRRLVAIPVDSGIRRRHRNENSSRTNNTTGNVACNRGRANGANRRRPGFRYIREALYRPLQTMVHGAPVAPSHT